MNSAFSEEGEKKSQGARLAGRRLYQVDAFRDGLTVRNKCANSSRVCLQSSYIRIGIMYSFQCALRSGVL